MSTSDSLEDKIAMIMAGQYATGMGARSVSRLDRTSSLVQRSSPLVAEHHQEVIDELPATDRPRYSSPQKDTRSSISPVESKPVVSQDRRAPSPNPTATLRPVSPGLPARSASSSPPLRSSSVDSAGQRNPDFDRTVNLQQPTKSAVQVMSQVGHRSPTAESDGEDDTLDFLGVSNTSESVNLSESELIGDHPDDAAAQDISMSLALALEPKQHSPIAKSKSPDTKARKPSSGTLVQKPVAVKKTTTPARPVSASRTSRPSSLSTPTKAQAAPPATATATTPNASRGRPTSIPRSQPTTPARNASPAPSARSMPPLASSRNSTPSRGARSNAQAPSSVERQRHGSPDSASAYGERVIRLAVRVRPFNEDEHSHRARRTISKVGNDIVVVNPNAFEAEPDTIAAAAIAVNTEQWAHAFSFDHSLWSYDISRREEKYFDQVAVHEALGLEIVETALSGISCSCFAYGHTGTGKTYTLFGPPTANGNAGNSRLSHTNSQSRLRSAGSAKKLTFASPVASSSGSGNARRGLTTESGLIPRIFHDIVKAVKENLVTMRESRIFFSCFEIYNEMVVDLLVDPPAEPPREDSQDVLGGLRVREHPVYGPYVENLHRVEVFSVEDVFQLLETAERHRSVAHTAWNLASSRSHAIATLDLAAVDVNEILRVDPARKVLFDHSASNVQSAIERSVMSSSGLNNSMTGTVSSNSNPQFYIEGDRFRHDGSGKVIKVQMVDLAGSEKDGDESGDSGATSHQSGVWSGVTQHDTTPNAKVKAAQEREKKELKLIRRSLATLGFIIQSLAKGASFKSLPYRDSTLTFLLRDSLNGFNHTTLIATISPAHQQFDETLATLRYAEKLTALRRRQSSAVGLSISRNALQEPRAVLIDQFRRYHSDLDVHHKGSATQRQLLKETVADPQQRIAKLTRGNSDSHIPPFSPATPMRSMNMSTADVSFTSPIDGNVRRLHDLTAEDLAHLQSSYRTLQGQIVEMQIDLDAVRTDRDTLVVELRATRDRVHDLESTRDNGEDRVQQMQKTLRVYEKEVAELRAMMRRKDDEADRLAIELNEHKQARAGSEQAYHSRTKEFLARFDAMKKENKALQAALELANTRDNTYVNERLELMNQVQRLKKELEEQGATHEDAHIEVKMLRQDVQLLKLDVDDKQRVEHERRSMEHERNQLLQQVDTLQSDLRSVTTERDSLLALVKQKDSLLWIQAQQSEASIKMLQQRQFALERAGADASNTSQDFQRLLESLRELFQRDEQSLSAAEGGAGAGDMGGFPVVLDTERLLILIRDLKEKIVLFDRIDTEYHALDHKYRAEVAARQSSEEKFFDLSRSLQSAEHSNAELSRQLVEVHRELESTKRKFFAAVTGTTSTLPAGNSSPPSNKHPHLLSRSQTDEFVEVLRSYQQVKDQLRSQQEENLRLQTSLQSAQQDTITAKEEVTSTQQNMQRELTTLWMSVQELNKLDALKDQSIQELMKARSTLTLERDDALDRLRQSSRECESLRDELAEVDRELQRAATQGLSLNSTRLSSSTASASHMHQQQHQPQQHHQQQQYAMPMATTMPMSSAPQYQYPPPQYQQQQHQQQQQQYQQQMPLPPFSVNSNSSYSNNNNNVYASTEYQPQQQQQQQQQQHLAGSKRRSQNGGSSSVDDDGMTERILVHQIEELNGFLEDEDRLKRVRLAQKGHHSPSAPSPTTSLLSSSRQPQQQHQQQQQRMHPRDLAATQPRAASASRGGGLSMSTPQHANNNNSNYMRTPR